MVGEYLCPTWSNTQSPRYQYFSHIHHEHILLSLQHKFFTMPILPKSKPKFIQQHYNLPTLSKFHKPPTLSKLHHDQKTTLQECSKAKIFKHDQSHNDPKFQNNQMTISHHATFNETCNKFFFSQARKPKKNSPWCLHDNMEHGS